MTDIDDLLKKHTELRSADELARESRGVRVIKTSSINKLLESILNNTSVSAGDVIQAISGSTDKQTELLGEAVRLLEKINSSVESLGDRLNGLALQPSIPSTRTTPIPSVVSDAFIGGLSGDIETNLDRGIKNERSKDVSKDKDKLKRLREGG